MRQSRGSPANAIRRPPGCYHASPMLAETPICRYAQHDVRRRCERRCSATPGCRGSLPNAGAAGLFHATVKIELREPCDVLRWLRRSGAAASARDRERRAADLAELARCRRSESRRPVTHSEEPSQHPPDWSNSTGPWPATISARSCSASGVAITFFAIESSQGVGGAEGSAPPFPIRRSRASSGCS
jgi:hypothetical protein